MSVDTAAYIGTYSPLNDQNSKVYDFNIHYCT